MTLAPGDEFAGYTIEAVLGTGGMGAVYLAKHPRLPRRDALKLLNPVYSADAGFRARFEREADLAAGLIHRNIVAVYDRGSVDGQLWIAMQYVRGTDAAVAMRAGDGSMGDGSMTPERVVHIVSEVGAGLDYAHRAGLLHRDVKPANILLAPPDAPGEPEHVLLTDFGIAKSTDEVQHLTGTGNLLATLAYASPEQIEAKPLDHRVDIYALGCVMYELLTGAVPFAGETPFATMRAHLHQPPPRPSAKVPGLPPALDDVVVTAMAKDREERYSSCRKLSLAARAALTALAAESSTPPTPPDVTPVGPGEFRQAAPDVAPEPEAVPEPMVSLTAPRPPFVIHVRRSGPTGVAELGPGADRPAARHGADPNRGTGAPGQVLRAAGAASARVRRAGRRVRADPRVEREGKPGSRLRAQGSPAPRRARRADRRARAAGAVAAGPPRAGTRFRRRADIRSRRRAHRPVRRWSPRLRQVRRPPSHHSTLRRPARHSTSLRPGRRSRRAPTRPGTGRARGLSSR